MHHNRAKARGAATNGVTKSNKQRKFHTKAKRTLGKFNLHGTTTNSSPQQQQQRNMSMNVWDDKSVNEINTYSALEGDVVIAQTHHSQSFLHLNRPKQLNALNTKMIKDIRAHLRKWETNPQTLGVIMDGVGGKAFCAGGDILSLYNAGKLWNERGDESGWHAMAGFFEQEYQLNWNISRMVTPFAAFMNGINKSSVISPT